MHWFHFCTTGTDGSLRRARRVRPARFRVSLGMNHDIAAFAVEAIRRWWHELGAARYPAATKLLISADCGGNNGARAISHLGRRRRS